MSRTAVWKAIGQLRDAGYTIESVSNRGYRLLSASDVLSEDGIRRHLKNRALSIQVYKTITSTNTVLKSLAAEGAPAGLALVAGEQTAGRGRMGRSFYSPADSGLYLSLLLRPNVSAVEATLLTACALFRVGVAHCQMPVCALGGATLVLLCDLAARGLFAPYEVPVGILLSFVGGPFFLVLLLAGRREGR